MLTTRQRACLDAMEVPYWTLHRTLATPLPTGFVALRPITSETRYLWVFDWATPHIAPDAMHCLQGLLQATGLPQSVIAPGYMDKHGHVAMEGLSWICMGESLKNALPTPPCCILPTWEAFCSDAEERKETYRRLKDAGLIQEPSC